MSVKHGLLTILSEGPHAGYELRREFEQRTGGTWPLNISQIYSTLQRLERDGLVASTESDDSDATLWEITHKGTLDIDSWWYTATQRSTPSREETTIKVALAITSPLVDTGLVIARQRTETMRALRDYTTLKSRLGPVTGLSREDLAWSLLLDSYIFNLEAEMRWLDHVEARLAMHTGSAAQVSGRADESHPSHVSLADSPQPDDGSLTPLPKGVQKK